MYRNHYYSSTTDMSAEVEALQTDVMRFMAILGLCLMAIFALVQSLPMRPDDSRPRMESENQLQAELQDLSGQVKLLQQRAGELQQALQQSREEVAESVQLTNEDKENHRRNRQQAEAAQQQLQAALQESEHQASLLEQALAQQYLRVEEMAADAQQHKFTLEQLRRELEKERLQKQQYQKQLEKLSEKMAAMQRRESAPAPEPKPRPPEKEPASEQEGFSLRFYDAAALHHQVNNGGVKFYAIVGKKMWGLKLAGRRPTWSRSGNPGRYHHMSSVTVPPLFSRSFHAQVSARGRAGITWGVTLPSGVRNKISALMQGRKGGDLVINATGQVTITP